MRYSDQRGMGVKKHMTIKSHIVPPMLKEMTMDCGENEIMLSFLDILNFEWRSDLFLAVRRALGLDGTCGGSNRGPCSQTRDSTSRHMT